MFLRIGEDCVWYPLGAFGTIGTVPKIRLGGRGESVTVRVTSGAPMARMNSPGNQDRFPGEYCGAGRPPLTLEDQPGADEVPVRLGRPGLSRQGPDCGAGRFERLGCVPL